jgi:hypothetical protein
MEYGDCIEILPGIFVDVGNAIYIADDNGEVASWNLDEWLEDPDAITATICAVALAAKKGANSVRENIKTKGLTLDRMILETENQST